jgi:UDP-glucose:O-linked fucose beta-1,3-glucosyltransferase
VEAMRNQLKMGKEELDEWLKVQREKEEDNIVLEKYAKEDDHKIKDLSLQMKALVEQVQKKKGTLAQEVCLLFFSFFT